MVEYLIGSMIVMLFIISVVNRYYYVETLGAFSNMICVINGNDYEVVVSHYAGSLLRGSIALRLTVTRTNNVSETYIFRINAEYSRDIPWCPVMFRYIKIEDADDDSLVYRSISAKHLLSSIADTEYYINRYIWEKVNKLSSQKKPYADFKGSSSLTRDIDANASIVRAAQNGESNVAYILDFAKRRESETTIPPTDPGSNPIDSNDLNTLLMLGTRVAETNPFNFTECTMTTSNSNKKRGEYEGIITCDEFGRPDRPIDSLIPKDNVTTKYPSEFDTYTPPHSSDSSSSGGSESYSSSSDSGSSSFD